MSKKLCDYTDNCIISFVDPYRKSMLNTEESFILPITDIQMKEIAKGFSEIANSRGINLKTCAEKIDLYGYGIKHASCIVGKLIEKITGYHLIPGIKKDSQREGCECIECIDIGEYDSCLNGCKYCYASKNHEKSKKNYLLHNPDSKILIGNLSGDEKINDRKVKSLLDKQIKIGDSSRGV